MKRIFQRTTTLTLTLLFIFGLLTACSQDMLVTAPVTPMETTAAAPPPTEYQLRIEFTSSADWANLNFLNPEYILSVDLESVSGNPSFYDVTAASLAVDQSISAAENGDTVGITVDYVLDSTANEQPLDLQLQRGSINECAARIYHLVGDDYQLVLEVENRGERGTDGRNTLDFSLDLNTMAEVASESPTPESTAPPSDAASIIFHNGYVLSVDDQNTVFEALAIKGDKILAVGSEGKIMALQGSNTITIDLQGKTLMPGFADGHNHLLKPGNRPGSLDEALDFVLMNGYTSMTEMAGEEGNIEELMEAEEGGRLRIRVNVFPMYNFGRLTDEGEVWYAWQWYPGNDPILDHDRMLRIPGIKVFVDGALAPLRGCWALREPYSAEMQAADWFKISCFSEYGDLYFDQKELNQIVEDAQAAGFRVAFHANGDQAIEDTLDAIEFALNGEPNNRYRHQIQHSSFAANDLMPRYQSLDVLTSLRGHFHSCTSYGFDWELLTNKYRLPGMGVHAYLETDFNWQRTDYRVLDPFVNMFSLVNRRQIDENGNICDPPPGIPSNNAITIEMALKMMTIEPAYAVSQEDYLGSLEPGKFADMVILAENPLTLQSDDLMNNEVLMTMVGGHTEYCATGYERYCP